MDIYERNEVIRQISRLINALSDDDKQYLMRDVLRLGEDIPISVFRAPLSALEIVVKYLKEEARKPVKQIAKLLNRKTPTIYATYKNSLLKFSDSLDTSDKNIRIPVSVFTDRRYSVLESLVNYLKEKEQLSLKEVAARLGKSYNTIKTVSRRHTLKKREVHHGN